MASYTFYTVEDADGGEILSDTESHGEALAEAEDNHGKVIENIYELTSAITLEDFTGTAPH